MKKTLNKTIFVKYLDYFIKGVYAGIMIGVGSIAYLAIPNNLVGAFIFSVGLLTICMYGMNLYTGKIGYILINKTYYIWELFLTLVGNFIGTFLVGSLIRYTRFSNYVEVAKSLVEIKLNDSYLSIFILAIFCGIMMYIAVNNYKKVKDIFGKYVGIFICVMTFILCGFEHSIANMAYFSIANVWNLEVVLYLLIMVLGNSIGSILISLFYNRFYKN